jgi:hypothetical protein
MKTEKIFKIMTSEELAVTIRRQKKQKEKLEIKANKTISECKHDKVIILCSYYGGSYSYDRDDWHPEIRKCLVCNSIECGPSTKPVENDFKILKNPIKRFEYSIQNYTNKEWINCPLNHILDFSLKELIKWVDNHGYRC